MDLNVLNQRFNDAKGLYFAAIRIPGEENIIFFYSTKAPELKSIFPSPDSKLSFVIAPYGSGELGFVLEPECLVVNDEFKKGDLNKLKSNTQEENSPHNISFNKEEYMHYVQQSVNEIKSGKLKKTVAARCESVNLGKNFSYAEFFKSLCEKYPDACIYHYTTPEGISWTGATPEKLFSVRADIVRTVALAGTLPADTELNWTEKEKEEQSQTAKFIKEVFNNFKLKGLKESPVKTINAGNVNHLISEFEWKRTAETGINIFKKLLAKLNPTPAVCGYPQLEAASFISLNEKMERRFYSGFVGIMNTNELNLFVNLRCMESGKSSTILYAGAGITKDSNPENEWNETAGKMNTIRSLL